MYMDYYFPIITDSSNCLCYMMHTFGKCAVCLYPYRNTLAAVVLIPVKNDNIASFRFANAHLANIELVCRNPYIVIYPYWILSHQAFL